MTEPTSFAEQLAAATARAEQASGIVLAAERRAEHAEAERDAAIVRAEQAEHLAERLQARLNATEWDAQAKLIHAQRQQLDLLRVRAEQAETALAAGVPLICCDERHAAKVSALETRIAALDPCIDRVVGVAYPMAERWADADALDGPADTPAAEEPHQPIEQAEAAPCDHRNPKRLACRSHDLAVICACGAEVMPGFRVLRQTEQERSFMADSQATFVEPFARAEAARQQAEPERPAEQAEAEPTMICTGTIEEVAGETVTLHAWLTAMRQRRDRDGFTPNWLGRIEHEGFPAVTDDSLPPGEIHLRPRRRPAAERERPAGWCPTCEGKPRQANS